MEIMFDVSDGRITYRRKRNFSHLGITTPRKGEHIDLVPGVTFKVKKVKHSLFQKITTIYLIAGCGLDPQTQEAFDEAGWTRIPAYEV